MGVWWWLHLGDGNLEGISGGVIYLGIISQNAGEGRRKHDGKVKLWTAESLDKIFDLENLRFQRNLEF